MGQREFLILLHFHNSVLAEFSEQERVDLCQALKNATKYVLV